MVIREHGGSERRTDGDGKVERSRGRFVKMKHTLHLGSKKKTQKNIWPVFFFFCCCSFSPLWLNFTWDKCRLLKSLKKTQRALRAAAMCTASLKKTIRCAHELCGKRPRYSAFTDYRSVLSELNTLYITDHLKSWSKYRFAINRNKNATRTFCTTFQFRCYCIMCTSF